MHLLWRSTMLQRRRTPKDQEPVTLAVILKSNVSFRKTVRICLADVARRLVASVTSRRQQGSAKRKKLAVLQSLRSAWKSSRLLWLHKQVRVYLTLHLQLSRPRTVCQRARMVGRASATSASPVRRRRIIPLMRMHQPTSAAGQTTLPSHLVHRCLTAVAVLQQQQPSTHLQKRRTVLRCHGLSQAMSPVFFTTPRPSSSFSVSIPSYLLKEPQSFSTATTRRWLLTCQLSSSHQA